MDVMVTCVARRPMMFASDLSSLDSQQAESFIFVVSLCQKQQTMRKPT